MLRFYKHNLEVFVEDGQIHVQPEPWTNYNKKIRELYEQNRDQIHLAAIQHYRFAARYIRNWDVLKIKTPKELKFKKAPTVCSCTTCQPCVVPEAN